jgi:hypothetical protein
MDINILKQLIREELYIMIESTRVRNPETGKYISLKTALSYDEHHPAYKAAKIIADKKRKNKKSVNTQQKSNIF